jgi:D-threonate/D-erythronate kinase
MRLGVIADDLTGAFDTGVQFSNWGMQVEVLLKDEAPYVSGADVVVVDTESRECSQDEAYRRVTVAVAKLKAIGVEKFYKKVDSTLRGNIGFELEAAISAVGSNMTFFAPSYPTYGRTTLAGKQLVNNVLLEKTEYAKELLIKSSDVMEIINHQCSRRVGLIGIEDVKLGPNEIRGKVSELKSQGVEIILFDAYTEKHLADVAQTVDEVQLVVGSAGLASELPVGIGMSKRMPVISVCGSTRYLSRVQVTNLVERLGFREVQISVDHLIQGGVAVENEVKRCVDEAVELIRDGVDISITASPLEEFMLNKEKNGVNPNDARYIVGEVFGKITSEVLSKVKVKGLLLTGGATSLKVCEKLGVGSAKIVTEVEPGMPLVLLSNGILAVTKAGGFGVENSLIQAAQYLRRRA